MAEICCGIVSDGEGSAGGESSSRAARRRRMEIRRFKYVAGVVPPEDAAAVAGRGQKRPKGKARDCENAVENCCSEKGDMAAGKSAADHISAPLAVAADLESSGEAPKFGFASVCGRRRDMEDALATIPSFSRRQDGAAANLHYYGVYDGHGCSHVATRCGERLHELVREELQRKEASPAEAEWKMAMERSFARMDEEVVAASDEGGMGATCRCELQSPECDAAGSTAVVAVVTPDKVVVANCGDSRAVLCRNGKPIPLSVDHKPDRPDELYRIQAAGGRVIYWDGPRVLGVLAMSRAIGDNYLKPYVSCEPEVTMTDRAPDDDCLILASDGLWDVVSNETACGVARMCLRGKGHVAAAATPSSPEREAFGGGGRGVASDKACSDASMLLTKLALARHTTDNVSVIVVDLRRDT